MAKKGLSTLFLAAFLSLVTSNVFAAIIVQISSPSNGQLVTPGEDVVVSFTAFNAVLGLSNVSISLERGGSFSVPFSSFPIQNSYSDFVTYTIPSDATPGEELTISVTATGFADSPQTTSIVVIAEGNLPPENDNVADAQVIFGDSGTVDGSNVEGSKESSETNHGGNAGGASIWYQWLAQGTGMATIDTNGSAFNTVLSVYEGSSPTLPSALEEVVSDDDSGTGNASQVQFTASSGTTYLIAVDGFGGATGDVTLNWDLARFTSTDDVWTLYY